MPMTSLGQGYGTSTAQKQDDFRYVQGLHIRISKQIINKPGEWQYKRYVYIDSNCGAGEYLEDGKYWKGSPIITLENATKFKCPYDASFIDKGRAATDRLGLSIGGLKNCLGEVNNSIYKIRCGENEVELIKASEELKAKIRKLYAYGLIYVDPNGTDDIPFNALKSVLSERHMQKVDLLIYLSATNYKRVRAVHRQKGYERLCNWLNTLHKKHWQIRQPDGGEQWCFLFGTNWEGTKNQMGYPDQSKRRFYEINSEEGQEILERISYTEEEIKERKLTGSKFAQLSLF